MTRPAPPPPNAQRERRGTRPTAASTTSSPSPSSQACTPRRSPSPPSRALTPIRARSCSPSPASRPTSTASRINYAAPRPSGRPSGSIQPPSRLILVCDQTGTLNIPTWWSDILDNIKRYDGPNLIVPMSTTKEADRLEEQVGGGGRGGFQPDSRVRRAIEHHAMKRAAAHFKHDGWTVEDTHVGNPFDLRISRRGEVVQVEVKGTTGDGAEVVLTRGEVESAERAPSALFILRQVKITWISDEPVASGGEPILYMPWRVHDGRLTAVSYFYQPPGK